MERILCRRFGNGTAWFLANGGRSGDLAVLAEQLPNAEKWQNWQRWLVEHHLMSRNDAGACAIVSREISQTMDPFWHKANVICQAVQGNMGGARFAADILAASGVNDPVFYGLVNQVLNNAPPPDINPANRLAAYCFDGCSEPPDPD